MWNLIKKRFGGHSDFKATVKNKTEFRGKMSRVISDDPSLTRVLLVEDSIGNPIPDAKHRSSLKVLIKNDTGSPLIFEGKPLAPGGILPFWLRSHKQPYDEVPTLALRRTLIGGWVQNVSPLGALVATREISAHTA